MSDEKNQECIKTAENATVKVALRSILGTTIEVPGVTRGDNFVDILRKCIEADKTGESENFFDGKDSFETFKAGGKGINFDNSSITLLDNSEALMTMEILKPIGEQIPKEFDKAVSTNGTLTFLVNMAMTVGSE